MTKRPATLFPHTDLGKSDLERVLAHFAPLTIYRPWFMEGPVSGTESADASLVRVQRPPEGLRPDRGFIRLLSEYQLWMRQNPDKGYATFLSVTLKKAPSEDTPWEIRQMLRQMGEGPDEFSQKNTLKWHLTLHLARQLEEDRTAVEEGLKRLRRQGSPLAGAIEEGASPGSLFQDLPGTETTSLVEEHHIGQVLEAWFGLFGGYLTDQVTLLTLNKYVMQYVLEIFEDRGLIISRDSKGLTSEGSDPVRARVTSTDLPPVSENRNDPKRWVLSHLSKKTLLLLGHQETG